MQLDGHSASSPEPKSLDDAIQETAAYSVMEGVQFRGCSIDIDEDEVLEGYLKYDNLGISDALMDSDGKKCHYTVLTDNTLSSVTPVMFLVLLFTTGW